DSSVNTNIYNAESANREVDFVDVNFHPFPRNQNTGTRSSQNCDIRFFPRELRETILELISYHFHLHPLLPNDNNQYLTENEAYKCGRTGTKSVIGGYGPEQQTQT